MRAASTPKPITTIATPDRAEEATTLQRHPLLTPALIFLLALLIRLLYLWQLSDSPLVEVVMGDSTVYDRWARQIASGDWIGKEVFFQAPLYPYFVAIIYTCFGPSTWAVRIVQVVIGALSCSILSIAARKWFSPRVGTVTGLLLALYAPAIFYDGLIQKEVLALFLVCMLLFLMAMEEERPRWWNSAAMGIVLGLLALTRENGLILIPIVAGWLFMRSAKQVTIIQSRAARWTPLVTGVLGLAVILVPVGIRNQIIGGRFLLTTSNMGSNFYIGNQPGARGYYLPLKEWRAEAQFEQQDAKDLAEQATGHAMTPSEVSRYWLSRTFKHITAHPAEWTQLMFRKWFIVWNASEHMDTESIEAYADEAWLLKSLDYVFHFGIIAPLAVAGIWLTRSTWRRYAVWYIMILALGASIALFFVFGRFRFPMVALLIPFAAAGIEPVIDAFRISNLKHHAISLVFGIAAGIILYLIFGHSRLLTVALLIPIVDAGVRALIARAGAAHFPTVAICVIFVLLTAAACNTARFRQYDPLAITWANVAGALSDKGRFDEAIAYFQRSQQARPNRPETFYALAMAYERRGDDAEAERNYRLALTGQDKPVDVLGKLATVLLRRENPEEAALMFARMVEVDPDSADTRYRAGYGLAEVGRYADAQREYRAAIRIKPDHVGALNNLGMSLAQEEKFAEAREFFLRALALMPDSADIHNNVGQTLLDESRISDARPHFEAALKLNPDHDLAKENLAACEAGVP